MRRRAKASVGSSLDSLLDTMTNVVGILVIMLVVTQLGVGDAVKRIKGFVDVVNDEDFAATQVKSDEIDQLLKQHRVDWKKTETELPQDQLSLEQQQKLISSLQQDLKTIQSAKIDTSALQKEIEARRKHSRGLATAGTANCPSWARAIST